MRALAELYAFADRTFFDDPARTPFDGDPFPVVTDPVPRSWSRHASGPWVALRPSGHVGPAQGWKVHVAGTPDTAAEAIARTAGHCLRSGLPFKVLASPGTVRALCSKYAPRSASGKVATVYPPDEESLARCVRELAELLDGLAGPYLLTDVRIGAGPVHVRYGGFRLRWCVTDDGVRVPAVERPDGVLVPDERRPVFRVPEWVDPPDVLREALIARRSGGSLPFDVREALHFSNGGGVYLAHDPAGGREVVLKEARPHAGFDGRGRDAVERLAAEGDALEALAGVAGVPALEARLTVWEHHFLAVERVPGIPLQTWLATRHPLIGPAATSTARADYVRMVEAVHARVAQVIADVHARGWAFGDLHPGNVLVDDDGSIGLVDYECSGPADGDPPPGLGHAGFAAGLAGRAADRHALAVLRLWMYLPVTGLLGLCPAAVGDLVGVAAEEFPLGPHETAELHDLVASTAGLPSPTRLRPVHGRCAPEDLVRSLARGIDAVATPTRTDRLHPGDLEQFEGDARDLAHGAAGVLWARAVGVHPPPARAVRWLRDRAGDPVVRLGLLDGAHGIARALDAVGESGCAAALRDRVAPRLAELRAPGYADGLAGVGLDLLDVEGPSTTVLDLAARAAAAVASTAPAGIDRVPGTGAADAGTRAGLVHGWSGVAVFLLAVGRATGDGRWTAEAVRALHRDLSLCRRAPDGTLQVDGGFRILPHLGIGSAGIALAVAAVLEHVDDAELRAALPDLAAACESPLVVDAGLFRGRAGLMGALAHLGRSPVIGELGLTERVERAAADHRRRLPRQLLTRDGAVVVPGEAALRISADLATGAAGVLVALGAPDGAPILPLVPVPGTAASRSRPDDGLVVATAPGAGGTTAPTPGDRFDPERG